MDPLCALEAPRQTIRVLLRGHMDDFRTSTGRLDLLNVTRSTPEIRTPGNGDRGPDIALRVSGERLLVCRMPSPRGTPMRVSIDSLARVSTVLSLLGACNVPEPSAPSSSPGQARSEIPISLPSVSASASTTSVPTAAPALSAAPAPAASSRPANAVDTWKSFLEGSLGLSDPTFEGRRVEYRRVTEGAFDIHFAKLPMVGGNPNTYARPALVLTSSGQVETTGSEVVGSGDLDGDGRKDLVLSAEVLNDQGSVFVFSAIADRPRGPVELEVQWPDNAGTREDVRWSTERGKVVLVLVTDSKEITLQWNGRELVPVRTKRRGR